MRRLPVVPSKTALSLVAGLIGCVVVLLVAGLSITIVGWLTGAAALAITAAGLFDYVSTRTAWHAAGITLRRRLPTALAIGVHREVQLIVESHGSDDWQCSLFERTDASLLASSMPQSFELAGFSAVTLTYSLVPTQRGEVQ